MSDPHYRLVIADDHPLFRGALREAVSGLLERVEIAEAGTFDDVVALLDKGGDIDLVLLDLAMPGVRGFSGLLYLRAERPGAPVIVVSGNEDRAVMQHCLEFGAAAADGDRGCYQSVYFSIRSYERDVVQLASSR